MDFYDEVMRELLAAVGAALFVGNLLALVRRRRERATSGPRRSKQAATDLDRAPLARTVTYLVLGFVVMAWGIGSLIAS